MNNFFEDYVDRLAEHLDDMRAAIKGVSQAGLDWVPGPDMNSLAVLVAHTCGSGRYWVGDIGMGEPSGRIRDNEFKTKDVPIGELLQKIDNFETYVQRAVERLSLNDLEKPVAVQPKRLRKDVEEMSSYTISWALLHALEHTALHVGHAQITRQLWEMRG